jgi:hypothetical protein
MRTSSNTTPRSSEGVQQAHQQQHMLLLEGLIHLQELARHQQRHSCCQAGQHAAADLVLQVAAAGVEQRQQAPRPAGRTAGDKNAQVHLADHGPEEAETCRQ